MNAHGVAWLFIACEYGNLWESKLVWSHVTSEALTALSCYVISIGLMCLVIQRQDLPFSRIFVLFSAFITACATTDMVEIWQPGHSTDWTLASLKALTTGLSLCTALLLSVLIPKAVALPSTTQLEGINRKLEQEIAERKRAERELELQRMFLRQVIDTIPSAVFVKDKSGHFITVNQAAATIHGTTVEAMLGKQEPDFNPNFDGTQLEEFLATNQIVLDTQQPRKESQLILTAQGHQRWYQTVVNPFVDTEGHLQGIIGNSVDITDLKQTEAALQESEARFRSLIQNLNVGVLLRDAKGGIVLSNPAACQLLGLTEDQLLGKKAFDPRWHVVRQDGSPLPETEYPVLQITASCQAVRNVVMGVYRPQSDDRIWLLVNAEPQFDEAGLVKQVICTFSDISERKQAEEMLQQLARIDGLTQVANRRRFDEYLNQEWYRLKREQASLSLLLCDIDFFKLYNDHYGHQAGDACLVQVVQALQRAVKRPTDLVARYGGEEFAVILPYTNTKGATLLANAIQQEIASLRLPHARSQTSEYVTVSIGIVTTIPTDQASAQILVATADAALYNAKAKGRNTCCSSRL